MFDQQQSVTGCGKTTDRLTETDVRVLVAAAEQGTPKWRVAEQYGISESSVSDWYGGAVLHRSSRLDAQFDDCQKRTKVPLLAVSPDRPRSGFPENDQCQVSRQPQARYGTSHIGALSAQLKGPNEMRALT